MSLATPIENYGHLPTTSNVELSPDGILLAYVKEAAGKRAVVIYDLTAKKAVALINISNSDQNPPQLLWRASTKPYRPDVACIV